MRAVPSPVPRHRSSARRRRTSETTARCRAVAGGASSSCDAAVRRTHGEAHLVSRAREVGRRGTFPDDLFTELVGNLDRVPRRQWPHVIAIAVALRHSWRRDGLTRIAKRLRISLSTKTIVRGHPDRAPDHHDTDSPARLGPVKALRFASTPRGGARGLDGALGRATDWLLRDGRGVLKTVRERRKPCGNYRSHPASR